MSSKGPKHLLCFKLSILISDFSDFQHIMPRDRYRRRSTSEEEHDEPQQQYEEEHDGSQQYEEDSDDTSADQADQVDESSDDDDGGSKNGAELASYYGKFGRVDEKEVTLKLNKETLALFFTKILGKGELDRDGRELLRDKYYLSPDQFKKLAPPDLLSTKLHLVKSLDFSGLSGMLGVLHSKTRDVTKVLLYMFENLVGLTKEFETYEGVDVVDETESQNVAEDYLVKDLAHYRSSDAKVPVFMKDTPVFNKENFDGLLAEARALTNRHDEFYEMYKRVLTSLVKSDGIARLAKETHIKSKEWAWDMLQLNGQADVFLTRTRESKYEDFLQPGFKAEMKNRSKDPEKRREKFSSNKLFSKDLDKEVKEHSKDNRKVNFCFNFESFQLVFFRWPRSLN